MKRVLFLYNTNEFFQRRFNSYGIDIQTPYKNFSFKNRRLANVGNAILPGQFNFVFDNSIFEKYTDIVLFDGNSTKAIVKWLSANKKTSNRLYYWYWNPLRMRDLRPYLSSFNQATYCHRDSREYGIRCLDTFYFSGLSLQKVPIVSDVYFLGGDKGRYNRLINLQRQLQKMKIKTDFHIVKSGHINFWKKYSNYMPYKENLNYIAQSRAILEILADPTDGLSLRAMEALFFGKKLITNSREILEHPFYNKNNIFVLGKDEIKDLTRFLESPFQPINPDILQYYEFEEWLKRLLK